MKFLICVIGVWFWQFTLWGQNEIKTVETLLNFVRSNYVASSVLKEKVLNEALFLGLKNYLGEGFEISQKPLNQTPSLFHNFREVWLEENLVLQFGIDPISNKSEEDYRAKLKTYLREERLKGLILDVRGWRNFYHYSELAQFLSWWVAPETVLFGFKGDKEEWFKTNGNLVTTSLPIVVLVNQETSGLGEVMAEVFRYQKRAIIIGSNSSGAMVRWMETKGSDDLYYRVAHEQVFLTSDRSLFPALVKPDLEVLVDIDQEKALLEEEKRNVSLTSYVYEQEKVKKNNEAALNRGEFSLEAQESQEKSKETTLLYDRPLQRAVDFLSALSLWHKP